MNGTGKGRKQILVPSALIKKVSSHSNLQQKQGRNQIGTHLLFAEMQPQGEKHLFHIPPVQVAAEIQVKVNEGKEGIQWQHSTWVQLSGLGKGGVRKSKRLFKLSRYHFPSTTETIPCAVTMG